MWLSLDIGFFLVVVVIFFVKEFFIWGGGVWIEKLFYCFNKWVYDCDFYIYVVYKMCFNI